MQRARPFAGDLLIGALAALGQAPFGLWPVTVAAMAAGLWRVSSAPGARAAGWRALAIGSAQFAMAMFWIVDPFLVEPEIYGWMAPFALILMALGGGLFWAVPTFTAALLLPQERSSRSARLALIACFLLASDWMRGWLFTGLPWALIGHIWIDTPVLQIAAWGGAMVLSALTLAAAALPVWGAWRWPGRTGIWRGAALALMLIAAAWLAGLARLNVPAPADTGRVVRLVQPNADQTLKWDPAWARVFYARLLDLSALPLKAPLSTPAGRPDLVVWPETAVPFLLNDAGPALPTISDAAGAPLLVGIQRADGLTWFNSLAEIRPDATVGQVYDKFHLVPFGEYIPWGDRLMGLGIRAFAAQAGNGYTAGPGPQVMNVGDLPPLQPLICYEAVFERHLLSGARRPAWLLQVTNDAWFGTWSGPYQHLAQARLRAVQSGLPLLRAANTGVSASIDAFGAVRGRLELGKQGVLDAVLPGALPPTLWSRTGDWPMLAALLLEIAVTLRSRRRKAAGVDDSARGA